MKFFLSFSFSLIIYLGLVFLFYNFFLQKNDKKEYLVHKAIAVSIKTQKQKKNIINKPKKKIVKKTSKKITSKKKIGSKSNFTKGGDVKFEDIFKTVDANIPTSKVKLKKELDVSRLKGVERDLKNIKYVNTNIVSISQNSTNKLNKDKVDKIIKKIGQIWDEISQIAGEYAKIRVVFNNGMCDVYVLDSNLDLIRQQELIDRIKSLKFNENFDLNIKFQTKVK